MPLGELVSLFEAGDLQAVRFFCELVGRKNSSRASADDYNVIFSHFSTSV
jgi:hypothetical protein